MEDRKPISAFEKRIAEAVLIRHPEFQCLLGQEPAAVKSVNARAFGPINVDIDGLKITKNGPSLMDCEILCEGQPIRNVKSIKLTGDKSMGWLVEIEFYPGLK